ncbi:MAG: nucleotidyltransferase domain-containing protein [Brevefilum sp.]|nr:nucleotidyltransferase domain-containing protein [Brevefilum sp.]
MNLDQIRAYTFQLKTLAKKYGISKIFVAGSVARDEEGSFSDVDFLVEMDQDASLFGVAGFMYEAEQLLGVSVDVIPISLLSEIDDQIFAVNIQQDSIML